MKTCFATIAAGLLLAGLAGIPPAAAQSDADILNFALNLEYLEAEFYHCAMTGIGLSAALRGGGPACRGCQKANLTGSVLSIATEIAEDEINHVVFLRTALGAAAVPMPLIDIGTRANGSFSIVADAAFNTTFTSPLNPYVDNLSFLLGAFIFEDVGVSAYQGALAALSPAYLSAATGILAIEAYHAGSVRQQLIENSSYVLPSTGHLVYQVANAISALRAKLSDAKDDQGILIDGNPNLTPDDSESITFPRTARQVISVVTGGGKNGKGLFFPNGLNGAINGSSTASVTIEAATTGRKLKALEPANVSDADIFAFALNLEYLEAEFFTWATTGAGIPSKYIGSSNNPTIGATQAQLSGEIQELGVEFATDELHHVIFLRTALGSAAPDKPAINFNNFAAIANAAFGSGVTNFVFNPFNDDFSFLLGCYIFEDVGVTAYHGGTSLVSKSYLTDLAGIMAVEAYHAGAIRTVLFENAGELVQPYSPIVNITVADAAAAIAALRAKASGAYDDHGITTSTGGAMIADGDANSIAYSRNPNQVISITMLGSQNGTGGFYPNGLLGPINGTAASIGAVDTVPTLPPSPGSSPAVAPSPAPAPSPSSAIAAAASAMALVTGVVSMLVVLV